MKFSSSLKLNHIFRKLYHTKGVADGYLVLYARKNRLDVNRVGLTVSKKLGKAHIRNYTRRRLREIYRLHEHLLRPGADMVIVARGRSADAAYSELDRDFLAGCRKLDLLREESVR